MSLGAQASTGQVSALPQDSATVCQLLEEARLLPISANYPLFFAWKFLGKPYVAHTLEINDDERLVVNTRQLDCTTLVETVTALTLCAYRHLYTWRDYLNALVAMRYRGGCIDTYTSRIHYFTEWITANTAAGIVTEIQAPDPYECRPFLLEIEYLEDYDDCSDKIAVYRNGYRSYVMLCTELRLVHQKTAYRKEERHAHI